MSPVISILNFWFLDEFFDYAKQKNIQVHPTVLHGPDYLALDVIPDTLKSLALDKFFSIKDKFQSSIASKIELLLNNNVNQCLFMHTISHIIFLDKLRNESLFDLLPTEIKIYMQKCLTENHEYK